MILQLNDIINDEFVVTTHMHNKEITEDIYKVERDGEVIYDTNSWTF